MPAHSLYRALDTVARPLRSMSGVARMLGGAAIAAGILALAAWTARGGWLVGPVWTLIAWAAVGTILLASAVTARRAMGRLAVLQIGQELERAGAWRSGALTTVLDAPAAGTSDSLHVAAADIRASEVLSRAGDVLLPTIRRQRYLARNAVAAIVAAFALLLAARPASGAPARLWHPLAAWRALVAPVRLSARTVTVDRGERGVLDLAAIGHRSAMLYTRAPGEAWRATPVALDTVGNATFTTPPLAADLVARLEAGGRKSPEVRIEVRLAAFLGAFTATAHYPAYLGHEDESLPTTGDTLVLPEGTRLTIGGRATTAIASARLSGPDGENVLLVAGSTFTGELRPRQSGRWRLQVSPGNGARLQGDMPSLPIRVVADSAPVVEIPVPGADTVAIASMSLALVIGVRDDHGITAAALETRRNGAALTTRTALPLPPGGGDRALITTAVDLGAVGLKAGDTLRYLATATDNSPARHVGRSREFVVRIPTEAEQRAARTRETAAAANAFDSLSKQAARVQRTEEDLARERQRTDPKAANGKTGEDGQKDPLASEAARTAAAAAQAQQQVLDDAAKLQREVQELRQAAER
ncbi:MAG: hypothetical protein ACHP7E_09070, partial [Burkholderiales bacterium]